MTINALAGLLLPIFVVTNYASCDEIPLNTNLPA